MKPLKLEISAFGPYAKQQTINFLELKGKNIFLITGPTGAGKTTIFDAISYALFGEASGSSRSKDSLRSDFASIDTLTYVELEFELRGKEYKIKRVPQQERKKARGEGTMNQNAEAELYLPNGSLITKVNTVDKKINEILGITKEQFRQIVMLPQGEFRKLLEADSIEREAIFRKIFGTEAFAAIQKKLEEQKKSAARIIGEKQTKRETIARSIEAREGTLLMQLIHTEQLNIAAIVSETNSQVQQDYAHLQQIEQQLNKLSSEQEKLQGHFIEGQEINKKLTTKSLLEERYQELAKKQNDYEDRRQHLNSARKTLPIIERESTCNKQQLTLDKQQQALQEATQHLEAAEKAVKSLQKQLQEQEAKEDERKRLAEQITTLKNQKQKVAAYEQKNKQLQELQGKLQKQEKTLAAVKEQLKKNKQMQEQIISNINKAQEAEVEEQKLSAAYTKQQQLFQEVNALVESIQAYIEIERNKATITIEYETIDQKYKQAKSSYEQMDDSFRRGQAGLLASQLHVGLECPVCGSTEHPKPAVIVDGVPTEEQLKAAKQAFTGIEAKREVVFKELVNIQNKLISTEQETVKLRNSINNTSAKLVAATFSEAEGIEIDPENEIIILKELKDSLQNEAAQLQKQVKQAAVLAKTKSTLEVELKKCQHEIMTGEETIEQLEKSYTASYGTVIAEQELVASLEQEVPEELRSLQKLNGKITELTSAYEQLVQAHKQVQEAYNRSISEQSSANASHIQLTKQVQQEQQELEELQQQLAMKIKESGFADYTHYAQMKMSEEQIHRLDADIEAYFQDLKSVKDQLAKAIDDTKDLQAVDVEQISECISEIKKQKATVEADAKNFYARITTNKKALSRIGIINEAFQEDEQQYGLVADLSKIANGDNEERITFERYVLAAYFDEIIAASNTRLMKMTGGRYVLQRKEERGKGRKQEGLELEVFDNYTGKARHVKTLSGGESFKASLALALGLADVVQSYAGGISIDTMFVDEGFGTLDPESLDYAIECLIDLQKGGRLVGVISHVPELKERIDVRLEITPAKEGSKAKFTDLHI
ncbi:AAA family ATPase [Desulfuribacillus alkaliarsenatis]|uniref:Nuclease SbcCD subunit C n=1 Tax=Desulfuribacillus alkaliarsenatis TaxID=766136 RepID=A0A1E5G2X6_9FIRM|nr:AAA family ATPase [Desulfuribacillus alkaliarsenatis]OEF97391.1 hypothetical protein BHF68_04060 [Desulfuribacillus alkaliarsenatis]